MIRFEGYERKIDKINKCMTKYKFKSLEETKELCLSKGIDVETIVKEIQPIAFEDAVWANTLGCAIALKNEASNAADAAEYVGIGLQAFCVPGSVADNRAVGLGHGKLASMLLKENTKCFCILAGHDSFAAAEGAIGIINTVNKARIVPLKVILNGLGKDAAYIISRFKGFTYVQTEYDYYSKELNIIQEKSFSRSTNASVRVYGANDSSEGIAIMIKEAVDISITGNSTNATRFQHLVAGIYKNWSRENGNNYFSVASGGGTGRTLHPDNVGAGPASYGLTDSMGRMHGDVQFAGSSSVPAHVEMMGFIGMGNNPIVGATVSLAVAIAESAQEYSNNQERTA